MDDESGAGSSGSPPARKTVAVFDPRALARFDIYVQGPMDRREFLRSVRRFSGTVGAVGLLAALNPHVEVVARRC